MKSIITLITFFTFYLSFSQITTTRMNDLKLGMKLSEAEKVIGNSLELSKSDDAWGYLVNVNNKGAELQLRFVEETNENDVVYYKLYEIKTTSKNIKTLSGIGIGNDVNDLWKAYKNYNISIWNQWDEATKKYSTHLRIFQLQDMDTSTTIYFDLEDGKISKISVNYYEGC